MRTFRIIAIAEAVTYLVLLVAVLSKRVLDGPDFVPLVGPVHGVVFLVYFFQLIVVKAEQKWSLGHALIVLGAALVPFGGFFVHGDRTTGDRTAELV